ncbi:MAG TPA: hypothetical protein H9903_11140 [Candidatus Aquabacterium excrementipullorum]|nr:hypothetical protein [Candidatus Aquabacterium excrementipullorum]
MARSSILGSSPAPLHATGRDAGLLGPSDSSDSGADIQGRLHLETDDDVDSRAASISGAGNTDRQADSDMAGTGERGPAVPEQWHEGGDIAPDRVVLSASEALDSTPELVSLDDPEAVDLENLVADEEDSEEEQPEDPPLASPAARAQQAGL